MGNEWMNDGRKIPDEVMDYVRKMAVRAVREMKESPELIAKLFGFSPSCLYDWLNCYDEGGYSALETGKARGAEPLIPPDVDRWLAKTVLESTPDRHGYDTVLWTSAILAELLKTTFGITVSAATVNLHLKQQGLTYQKPVYPDKHRDEREIERFLNDKFPRIQKLAVKLQADMAFEDEAGVRLDNRSGRTWGLRGHRPVIPAAKGGGGYNACAMVTPEGRLQFTLTETQIDSDCFIEFLKQLIQGRQRPLVLLVDRATFHGSKAVRRWVRQHRSRLRVFFLPKAAPEQNPAEQVWNETKNHGVEKQPVRNKQDLQKRFRSALKSLQRRWDRVKSFFQMPETQYANSSLAFNS
jgi:transposase